MPETLQIFKEKESHIDNVAPCLYNIDMTTTTAKSILYSFVYNDQHIDILGLTICQSEDAYVFVDCKQKKHQTIDIATILKGVFFIVR